jgi:3,4-dihydroxy-2-butanone 4-phosphate synthase
LWNILVRRQKTSTGILSDNRLFTTLPLVQLSCDQVSAFRRPWHISLSLLAP